MPQKLTLEIILERFYNVHGYNKFNYSLFTKYKNIKQKIPVICLTCNNVFYTYIDDHFRGHGCPYCSKKIVTKEMFIKSAVSIHGDLYDYKEVIYKNKKTPVKIFCKKCNEFFLQTPESHLQGSGCQKCAKIKMRNSQNLTKEEFIKRAIFIHDDLYDYNKVIYVNAYTPVKIYCKKCKQYFWQKPVVHLNAKCGCQKCSSSKGETNISILLKNQNIKFIGQYKNKDCKDKRILPFDFYLPDYNLCIEFQGEQHYDKNFYLRICKTKELAKKRFNDIRLHDQIKREFCKNNGIKLLEIRYDENIKEKLEEALQMELKGP